MALQAPPNGSGSVIDTIPLGGKERVVQSVGDGATAGNVATVDANKDLHVVARLQDGGKATYRAALTGLNPGKAATTVVASILGSATKKVRVTRVEISGTEATAAAYKDIQLVKSSTAYADGTATTAVVVPLDSTDAAGTAVVKGFTVAPTAGTPVGPVACKKCFTPITGTPAALPPTVVFEFGGAAGGRAVVLKDNTESLDIKFNGATPANDGSWDIAVEWTEE